MMIFQKYALYLNGGYVKFIGIKCPDVSEGFTVSQWIQGEMDKQNSTQNIYSVSIFPYFANRVKNLNSTTPVLGPIFTDGAWAGVEFWTMLKQIPVLDGAWHHIAITFDGKTWNVYLDGKVVATGTTQRGYDIFTYKDANFYLGSWAAGYGMFTGKIGTTLMYSRALTESEVLTLYNGGLIKNDLFFWVYPDEDTVTTDSSGNVTGVKELISGVVGTTSKVTLTTGKDIDVGNTYLLVKKL